MVVDLSGDSDDDSDDASDASEIDIELDEEGIIDLSNDDFDPIWRDDVDHYVEVNGLLLLLEYKICGAIGFLQVTQLDYCTRALREEQQHRWCWLRTICDESLQKRRKRGQVRWRAGQNVRQCEIYSVIGRRQFSGLRSCPMRGGLRQYAASTKQLQHQPL